MTPRPHGTFVAVALLVVAGGLSADARGSCRPVPPRACPAWRELASAHFRVRTDTDPDSARGALRDLEQFQAALLRVFGAGADLRHRAAAGDPCPRRVGTTSRITGSRDGSRAPCSSRARDHAPPRASSEIKTSSNTSLVHYLSAKVMPVQPLWLGSGTRNLLPDAGIRSRQGRGSWSERHLLNLLRVVQNGPSIPLPELLAATSIDGGRPVFYASAWAAVHFLMNCCRRRRARKRIREGAQCPPPGCDGLGAGIRQADAR